MCPKPATPTTTAVVGTPTGIAHATSPEAEPRYPSRLPPGSPSPDTVPSQWHLWPQLLAGIPSTSAI
ncbi:hypothetical protein E2562_030407 [Oryza meyeriana var. granulata]|uniref:Uncharacterized protein n=1 Tax=Oryza meyeriana var. granulata TaxID=110450 RepID=A0A6G1FDX2_9ORYZ|nr:hypothetical protein E2562_030407 [Oryza meyeriana var. granulata]